MILPHSTFNVCFIYFFFTAIRNKLFFNVFKGNELVAFNSAMFDLDNSPLFEDLGQETQLALEDPPRVTEDQKLLLGDALIQAEQIRAASEAADYLLNNESHEKKTTPPRSKVQKSSKAKRRKVK